jgi:hypothetical protein
MYLRRQLQGYLLAMIVSQNFLSTKEMLPFTFFDCFGSGTNSPRDQNREAQVRANIGAGHGDIRFATEELGCKCVDTITDGRDRVRVDVLHLLSVSMCGPCRYHSDIR